MNKILNTSIMFLLFFSVASPTHAIPYTDIYDADNLFMSGALFGEQDTVSWTFDITDTGFNPATQDVTSASVSLNLTDDHGWDFFEFATLDIGMNQFFWEVNSGEKSFEITSLMTLSETGMVNASLTAIWGDFYFNSAVLNAEGTIADMLTNTSPLSNASPVPEPAAMLLFGTGLVGLATATRRKFRIKR